MASPKAIVSRMARLKLSKRADRLSRSHHAQNWMERLPSDILIKILSYLDAAALFTLSHVSSLLYQLASDNALWHGIFLKEFSSKRKQRPKFVEDLLITQTNIRDLNAGYWKWIFFKAVADSDMRKWKKHLRTVNPHTGLPSKTEQVLRNLHITWQLTVLKKLKRHSTLDVNWFSFSESSVTLCWSGGLPDLQHISALQLFGVRRIALSCTGLQQPAQRSLMVNVDMDTVSKSTRLIGQDGMVELRLLQPGVVVGIWKDQCAVAFVMFCLHFDKLLERSTQGSSVCPFVEPSPKTPLDDIDPEYGLHSFLLYISLHNNKRRIMSESFRHLFCRKSELCDGVMPLTAISRDRLSEHISLAASITFPWRCEVLSGTVQDCCIMTLTLWDEFKQPLWRASSAVCLEVDEPGHTDFNHQGDCFRIHFEDADGQITLQLRPSKQQGILTVVEIVVYMATSKINSHFGTNY